MLVTSLSAQQKEGTVYMVSNAHFDSQWNWDVQQSINVYIRNTLTQNLWLMERYPDYIFNFEGGVKYSWMKEYYPEYFERVKKYIASGQWHVSGSSWDATDPNMPSPESFFRNIMLGQQFYKDEFGVKSTDIFLPDCFGFGYTIPTIASHCGLIGFSTQKLQWRQNPFYGDSKIPFLVGLWQGVDGSRIMAALDAMNYTTRYFGEDISHNKELISLVEKSPNHKGYRYYGTGDIGGSPTILSVMSVEKGIHGGTGPIDVVSATSDRLFKEHLPFSAHPELLVFDGELLMDVHATGCYTSQAAMKLYNRRNEQLADAAERASVMADWLGGLAYPGKKITEGWKRFVWHQFHDDLTGTSLPRAYTFSWNDELICQSQFSDIITAATASVARALNTQVEGKAVVVFNPLSQARKDAVLANVPMEKQPAGIAVYSKGKRVNSQLLSYKDGVAAVTFTADVAPTSYTVFDVRATALSKKSAVLKIDENGLENSVYKIALDKNGDIGSIFDKRTGRELVENGKAIRLALFTENKSFNWPAWEITKTTMDAEPVSIAVKPSISIAEQGEARVTLRVGRTYGDSEFVQYISLTNGGADDRIDIATEIDWRMTNALLKAEFPLSVANGEATYDLGIGSIRRGNNTKTAYEVYAQQWADLTAADNSYGVAVLNNSKYGWDKPNDNTLRLTLLHTPMTDRNYTYQNKQDQGFHSFTYSMIGHTGDYVDAQIVRKADAMNNPLFAFNSDKHKGALGSEFSLVRSSSPQIDIKAMKKAESGDKYVVRVYETEGRDANNVELIFNTPIIAANELNGIEEEIDGDVRIDGNKLIFSTTSFHPKTFGVKLAPTKTPVKPHANTMLDLVFNAEGFSNDAFLGMLGNFERGNTYSYDLLPERLVSEGVEFKFGTLEGRNVIKSDGDTIRFAANPANKTLYLLVASTEGTVPAEFMVDGVKREYTIPYYSGFFGQWGSFEQDFKGYVSDATVAYVGTHRHNRDIGNEPYVFTYMYKIAIPLTAKTDMAVLSKDKKVAVFAATLSDQEQGKVSAAADFRSTSIR